MWDVLRELLMEQHQKAIPWKVKAGTGFADNQFENAAVTVSPVVAWRMPDQGANPDVLSCI